MSSAIGAHLQMRPVRGSPRPAEFPAAATGPGRAAARPGAGDGGHAGAPSTFAAALSYLSALHEEEVDLLHREVLRLRQQVERLQRGGSLSKDPPDARKACSDVAWEEQETVLLGPENSPFGDLPGAKTPEEAPVAEEPAILVPRGPRGVGSKAQVAGDGARGPASVKSLCVGAGAPSLLTSGGVAAQAEYRADMDTVLAPYAQGMQGARQAKASPGFDEAGRWELLHRRFRRPIYYYHHYYHYY